MSRHAPVGMQGIKFGERRLGGTFATDYVGVRSFYTSIELGREDDLRKDDGARCKSRRLTNA